MQRFLVALMLCAGLPFIPTRADAICSAGCGATLSACGENDKLTTIACERTCQEIFDADPGAPNAFDDLQAWRDACNQDHFVRKNDCKAMNVNCKLTCSAATPACGGYCGDFLRPCAAPITYVGQACHAANTAPGAANTLNLASCGITGKADLDSCLTAPPTGFFPCLLACNSICGNGVLEAGEICDDNNTTDYDGCNHYCYAEDQDGDGIVDDGDSSAIVGDAPCTGGATAGCDDNCPTVANADQADADGDGVGDVCDANCVGSVTGATISGGVYLGSVGLGNELEDVVVSACQTGNTCCTEATTDSLGLYSFQFLDAGSYTLVAMAEGDIAPETLGPIVVSGNQVVPNTNIVMNNVQPVPPSVTVTNEDIDANGIPTVVLSADIALSTAACAGGTVTWSVSQFGVILAQGSMTEGPAGTFTVVPPIPANSIVADRNYVLDFQIVVTGCPNPVDNGVIDFNAWIDPSGVVRFLNGNLAPGATVTLLKGPSVSGPFTPVPDGSVIMSPMNRTNPDVTDGVGHFGWDVLPGYYQVIAEFEGCTVESAGLIIPPAVTDLDLQFACPCIGGPNTGCRTAAKNRLSIKNDALDDGKDAIAWKWGNGTPTSFLDFGTPHTSTDYFMCVYAGSTSPLMSMTVPSGKLFWKPFGGTKGYKYGNKLGLSSGITKIKLTARSDPKAKASVKGKGTSLPDAVLGSLPTPITVQLQASEGGLCLESVFGAADVSTNDADRLKATKNQ